MSDHHVYIVSDLQKSLDDMRSERDHYKKVADHLHTVLIDNTIMFRCDCDNLYCKEMRGYLDTVKSQSSDHGNR